MSPSANVTSIDALKRFRLALQQFEQEARTAITELELEMRRAMEWIEVDRARYWPQQLRNATDRVSAAQGALHQKQLTVAPHDGPSCAEEKKALGAAKRRLQLVQDRLQAVRRWRVNCQQEADELQGQLTKLSSQLDTNLPRAAAALGRLAQSLDAYVQHDAASSAPGASRPRERSAQPPEAPGSSQRPADQQP